MPDELAAMPDELAVMPTELAATYKLLSSRGKKKEGGPKARRKNVSK